MKYQGDYVRITEISHTVNTYRVVYLKEFPKVIEVMWNLKNGTFHNRDTMLEGGFLQMYKFLLNAGESGKGTTLRFRRWKINWNHYNYGW